MRTSCHARPRASNRQLYALLAAVTLVAVHAGCGSDQCGPDQCGPGDAPADGLTGQIGSNTVGFGQLTSSPNNDCNAPGSGISLTLSGVQTAPTATGLSITFCLPRPDAIDTTPISLADAENIEVIDVFAKVGDCITQLDRTSPATGTIEFIGYCDGGSNSAGYAIKLAGAVAATRTCAGDAGAPESVTLQLGGTAAVTAL